MLIKEILNKNYPDIVDHLISKRTDAYLHQVTDEECQKLVEDVFGYSCTESLLLAAVLFAFSSLIDQCKQLRRMVRTDRTKIANLEEENKRLTEELEICQKTLEGMNRRAVQIEKVRAGKKIAYREDVSKEDVYALLQKNMNKSEIAETLGVSRNTVYRRIEELRKAGYNIE